MIIGIDAGNNAVKVATANGLDRFSSAIGEYRERRLTDKHGADDIIFEYEGRKGFAGTLAAVESEFGGALMGESKAHEDAKLRILIALHRNCQVANKFQIVVGQPIGKHTDDEKAEIKRMLIGRHDIALNGWRKVFVITDVEVAAEGGAAFWSAPIDGLVRIIDVGSGTVNCATLLDKRFVDRDSFTLQFGMNTVRTDDLAELSRGIATNTSKKWRPSDAVYVVGGAADELTPHLRQYYPRATELQPTFNREAVAPIYANAIGFYNIGRVIYE